MKKFLAMLLILATLVPMGLVANAEESTSVTVVPFTMTNWSEVKEGKYDNVYSAPFFWVGESTYPRISWSGAGSEPKVMAQKVKELFDTRPEGARYIHFGFPAGIYLRMNRENHIYCDKGVTALKPWLEEFLTEYKAIGGKLDGMFLDTEIVDMYAYYLHQDAQKDPLVYQQIVSDPRYATEVRPLLEERGFKFWENVTDYTPEIYTISRNNTDAAANEARAIWDRVMRNRLAQYQNEAVLNVLLKYYPDAKVSDYQSADRAGWFKFLSDTGDNSFGELTASGGSAMKVGNTSNHNVYHSRPSGTFYKNSSGEYIYRNPYSYNEAVYEKTAFNMTMWEINQFKNIYASTDNKQMSAWLTSYNYGDKPLAYSAYTTEIVYHLGLLNPTPFLGYVVPDEVTDVGYYERLDVISQQLTELTRLVGYSDRKVIEVPANWNESFLLSGMYANGRNVWRITPDTTQIGLQYFQIEGTDPTFRVNGKTITFPGGKIIEDSVIDDVGSCGFWVETAKDVTPIVTTDANRLEQYPSLNINFESAKEGTFDYNNSDPAGAWEFTWNKKTGSATTIVTTDSGKALSVNGDVTLKSVKLPENITAGDTYAEDQAWEITATIPEGLATEAVINLLGYAGTKQTAKDGGFKLEGGKLYYSTVGTDEEGKAIQEYKELASLSAGTYTFKRVMNFNDPEKFTASYYVYDATGAELASAKDVAAPVFTAITSINFVTKAADKAILLDNYKITLTGKAADFELYDAKTGTLVKDMETARAASTAYRLSWLNATQTAETATVVAAIYEGQTLKEEKVIKEVAMNPGCDGVETGIVDVAEGQSVKVYLKTTDSGKKDNTGSKGEGKDGIDIGLIVIIAAAVVAVLAVVIALMATKPKKKPEAAAAEEAPEAEAAAEPEAEDPKAEE